MALSPGLFGELSLRTAMQAAPKQPRLDPEELQQAQTSLLKEIGGSALSGIAKFGNLFDVAGGTVRNILGGGSPFAPVISPTGGEGRLSGENLAEQIGLIDKDTHWLPRFVTGLGIEVALDPLTYATFGLSALGKAGRLAKKAGLLGDTLKLAEQGTAKLGRNVGKRVAAMNLSLDDLIKAAPTKKAAQAIKDTLAAANKGVPLTPELLSQPLSSAARFRLPFTDIEYGLGAAGKLGEFLPSKLDAIGNKLLRSDSAWSAPGRALAAAFSRRAGGAFNPEVQRAAHHLSYAEDAALAAAKGDAMRTFQMLRETGIPDAELNEMMRAMLEWEPKVFRSKANKSLYTHYNAIDAKIQALPKGTRELLRKAAKQTKKDVERYYKMGEGLGLFRPELDDWGANYAPRYAAETSASTDPWFTRIFSSSPDSLNARKEFLKNFREGTTGIEAMVNDDVLRKIVKPDDRMNYIIQNYLDVSGYNTSKLLNTKEAKQFAAAMEKQAKRLSDWTAQRGAGPVFGGVWENYTRYLSQMSEQAARGDALQNLISKAGNFDALSSASAANRLVPVEEILLKSGFGYDGQLTPQAIQKFAKLAKVKPTDVLNYGVKKSIADEVTKLMRLPTAGDSLRPMRDIVDSINTAWKVVNTGVNPAFHLRNRMSGVIQNVLNGMFDPSVERGANQLIREGSAIAGAEAWTPIARILKERKIAPTAENALKVIQELSFAHDIIGPFHGMGLDSLNDVFGQIAQTIPGARPMSRMDIIRPLGEKARWTKDFGKVRGVAGATETGNAIVKAGENAGYYVESMNRLSPFLTLLKQGWDPAAAAAKIKSAHVDYTGRAWSSAERSLLTRMFPFYKFGKGQASHVIEELLTHPGGGTAQMLRATRDLQGKQILPEYVGQGLAIPVSPSPTGDPQYLTSLGLMHEQDPFSFFGGGFSGAVQELGSRLTPMLKWPIETMTGESLFQRGPGGGRDLADMDPLVGRIAANLTRQQEAYKGWLGSVPATRAAESFISNFVFPRQLAAIRTVTDPRKGMATKALNTLTGARISTVSQRAMDARVRELAAQALQDTGYGKEFVKPYVPNYVQATMPPEDQLHTQAIEQILETLVQRAKARKENKPVPALGNLYSL